MTFTFKTLAAAAALAMLPLSAQAYSTITFGTGPGGGADGTLGVDPLNSFTDPALGLTFGVDPDDTAALFNTDCTIPCNDDNDLVPIDTVGGVAGNVLILRNPSENSVNDLPGGGTVTFNFTSGPDFVLKGFSAVDDGTFKIFEGTGTGGMELGSITLTGEGQTGITDDTFVDTLFTAGESFTFQWSGSGGFDNLQVNIIPLPAPFALLLAAMGGLGFVSWRRARAAA